MKVFYRLFYSLLCFHLNNFAIPVLPAAWTGSMGQLRFVTIGAF